MDSKRRILLFIVASFLMASTLSIWKFSASFNPMNMFYAIIFIIAIFFEFRGEKLIWKKKKS